MNEQTFHRLAVRRRAVRTGAIGAATVVVAALCSATASAVPTNPPYEGTAMSVHLTSGGTASLIAVGDLSGNGPHDVAIADGGSSAVEVLLNDGSGHFAESTIAGSVRYPAAIAVGDLGGTGPGEDIAVVGQAAPSPSPATGNLYLLLRDGSGGYRRVTVHVGAVPDALAIGDLNGDGHDDVAVTNAAGAGGTPDPGDAGSVTLALNNGDGTFTPDTFSAGDLGDTFQGTGPRGIAIGDFRGAGHRRDLAVISGNEKLQLFLQNSGTAAQPTFATPDAIDPGFDDYSIAAGDLGGPGAGDDIAIGNGGPVKFRGATVLLNQGNATFDSTFLADGINTSPSGAAVAIGNFGGGTRPGVAVTNPAQGDYTGSTSVFLKNSDGSWQQTTVPVVAPDSGPSSIAAGNLTAAGDPDKLDLFVGTSFSNTVEVIANHTADVGSTTATQKTTVTVTRLPGVLQLSVAEPTLSFGSVLAGTATAPVPVGDLIYTNTLDNTEAWSVAVAATSLVNGSSTIGWTSLSFDPGRVDTPGSTATGSIDPGTGGTFTGGADSTPGTTLSAPLTVATGTGRTRGRFTHSGSTVTLTVPPDATSGSYAGTVQYTILG